MIFLILNVIYIPQKIGFNLNLSLNNKTALYIFLEEIPVYFFLLDIIVTLNTSFYYKGTLVENKSKIIENYLKRIFFLDIISLGPFFIGNSTFIQILFLLRIIKMNNLVKRIKENLTESIYPIFELLKLLFNVIYIAHLCACLWHYVALIGIEKGYTTTWIHKNNLILDGFLIRYTNALYYSVLTMITVGFIDTDSNTEKAISIILDLVLAGVFAYSFSSISVILQDITKNESELKYL